jgi:hypothetical protein
MSNPEFTVNDPEWSMQLESEYEEYIWDCEEHIDYDPDDERLDTQPNPTLSGEPFCGCQTCYTREQLFFLVPRIIKAYKEGKISIEE